LTPVGLEIITLERYKLAVKGGWLSILKDLKIESLRDEVLFNPVVLLLLS
jgi:hypothetical protein